MKFNQLLKSAFVVLIMFAGNLAQANIVLKPVGLLGLGGLKYTTTDASIGAISTVSRVVQGGGILVESRFLKFGVETGALYVPVATQVRAVVPALATTMDLLTQFASIEIPILFRFYPVPIFSIGLGGFYQMGLGKVKTTTSSGLSATTVENETFSEAGLSSSDYGLEASLQAMIPMGTRLGIIIDGRYSYGLKDQDTSATGVVKANRISLLAGVAFRF